MNYPLGDLKVLDFSRVLAGPFAGRMLCDLGADVVKIEPPDGDITRYWGHEVANLPGYFVQQNAGKRNICLDLRAPGAADIVKRLVKEADIVIENYRPDVMGRLGIGYEDLSAVNEKIIMLSISGFGHNGPESRRATYAPVIHAEAGLISRNTQRNNVVLHDMPLSVADTNAALHGLVGLLSALHMRERTGKGQHIDIAMIDATIATDDQMAFDIEDANSTRSLPNEIWETPIGPVLLSTDFRVLFRGLTTKLGLEDPASSEMALDEKITIRRAAVQDFFDSLDTREKFVEAMQTINIAWGDVRDPASVQEQPTVAARGTFARIDDREGGTRPVTQSPYRFSNARSGVRGPAAHRGEHNEEVVQDWLSLSEDESRQLLNSEAFVPFDPDWRHH